MALCAWALIGLSWQSSVAALDPLLLGDGDRLLVLAPHPNDEILAAGGLIQEALALDLPVKVCVFTMGENNEIARLFVRRHVHQIPGARQPTGHLRQTEALAAAGHLGLASDDLVFLGFPASSTYEIWKNHWRDVAPLWSELTRSRAIPYDHVLTPGNAHAGDDILDDLEDILAEFQPTLVVLPHPGDHNDDHRALYLFARVALWNVEALGIAPELLAYPVHFTRWPLPRRFDPQRQVAPPDFLGTTTAWREFELAPFQVNAKQVALRRHHSQFQRAATYLEALVNKNELFGDVPPIVLPGGIGATEWVEPDHTRYRPDRDFLQELVRDSDIWLEIVGQHNAETAALEKYDHSFQRVGFEGDGRRVRLTLQIQRPLSPETRLRIFLYGYRSDIPFGDMPKIQITTGPQQTDSVKDLVRTLSNRIVETSAGGGDEVSVALDLAQLGHPHRILVGAELLYEELPLDWLAWRVIELPDRGDPSPLAGAPPSPPSPSPQPPAVVAPEPPAPPSPDSFVRQPPPRGRRRPPARPDPSGTPERLVPRVNLPTRDIPERSYENEPVFW